MQPPAVAPRPPAAGGPAVWLPWLLAPGFLLLPIGGCGLAASLRRPHADGATAGRPVTVATVATVVPRHAAVAWHGTAD